MATVLEITVGHRTLSDQIFKMTDKFGNMFGHDLRELSKHDYVLETSLTHPN